MVLVCGGVGVELGVCGGGEGVFEEVVGGVCVVIGGCL